MNFIVAAARLTSTCSCFRARGMPGVPVPRMAALIPQVAQAAPCGTVECPGHGPPRDGHCSFYLLQGTEWGERRFSPKRPHSKLPNQCRKPLPKARVTCSRTGIRARGRPGVPFPRMAAQCPGRCCPPGPAECWGQQHPRMAAVCLPSDWACLGARTPKPALQQTDILPGVSHKSRQRTQLARGGTLPSGSRNAGGQTPPRMAAAILPSNRAGVGGKPSKPALLQTASLPGYPKSCA